MRRLGAIALAALLCLAVVFSVRRGRVPPELDPPAVVAQIRELKQLATVRYTVQKVVGLKEQRYPVGAESILLIMQASVEAGIDLAALAPQDVSVENDGTVIVRLPAARVLNVIVDEKETKVWDREKTWWTPWVPYSKDFEQRARQTGIEAIRQAALDMQILKQAEANAETAIESLLRLGGAKKVIVQPGRLSLQRVPTWYDVATSDAPTTWNDPARRG